VFRDLAVRIGGLIALAFSLWVWGCSYSGNPIDEINFSNQRCDSSPQIDLFTQPKGPLCPTKAKAIIYYPAKGLNQAWKRRVGEIIYRAFVQAGAFEDLRLGSSYTPSLRTLAQKGFDFLIVIPRATLFFPTKSAPGHLNFDLKVFYLKKRTLVWEFSGSWNICPAYPIDYGSMHLSRGKLPPGEWDSLEKALYLTAWGMAEQIRHYGCYTSDTIPQAPWRLTNP